MHVFSYQPKANGMFWNVCKISIGLVLTSRWYTENCFSTHPLKGRQAGLTMPELVEAEEASAQANWSRGGEWNQK
jgi:hypothetical protein